MILSHFCIFAKSGTYKCRLCLWAPMLHTHTVTVMSTVQDYVDL